MNRIWLPRLLLFDRIPRKHGDEPLTNVLSQTEWGVFPVSTGMNRQHYEVYGGNASIPRKHGDEPY